MKKFKVLILDDSLSDIIQLRMFLHAFIELELKIVQTEGEFLKLDLPSFDLMIIDILIESNNTGIELVNQAYSEGQWVIVCSALDSSKYFEDIIRLPGKKFYLKKPISEFDLKILIESFLEEKRLEIKAKFLYLEMGNNREKVNIEDVEFIVADGHTCFLYSNRNKLCVYKPLKWFYDQLEGNSFKYANRQTLVNSNKINQVRLKEKTISIGDHVIKLSRSYKNDFKEF